MSPKDKALELYEKYIDTEGRLDIQLKLTGFTEVKRKAKKHSLIAVDEIIKQEAERCLAYKETDKFVDYWQEVKLEIKKL